VYIIGNVLDGFTSYKQCRHSKVPNVDCFQAHLLKVRFLLLPPFETIVINELSTLYPGSPIPLEPLAHPVLMDASVHFVLHGQHVDKSLFQSVPRSMNGSQRVQSIAALQHKKKARYIDVVLIKGLEQAYIHMQNSRRYPLIANHHRRCDSGTSTSAAPKRAIANPAIGSELFVNRK
jgi:hypothetical protein